MNRIKVLSNKLRSFESSFHSTGDLRLDIIKWLKIIVLMKLLFYYRVEEAEDSGRQEAACHIIPSLCNWKRIIVVRLLIGGNKKCMQPKKTPSRKKSVCVELIPQFNSE